MEATVSRSHSRIACTTLALLVSVTALAACGSSDSNASRTRNAAMSSQSPLPYSCAQLEPGVVNETTAYVYFSICDEAERFSIETPDDVDASVPDTDVGNREVIEVPVSRVIDGTPTILTIETEGSTPLDSFHPGVHIYEIVLSRADTNLVSSDDPFNGALYPKVTYSMPASQVRDVYQYGTRSIGINQYVNYIEEYVHKWAMIRLTTCYSSLGLSVMSQIPPKEVLAHAQIDAKVLRNRPLYIHLNSLRYLMYTYYILPNRCDVGSNSYNIFTHGVNKGFVPVEVSELSTAVNVEEILKTGAITWYQSQVVKGQCPAETEVNSALSSEELQRWGEAAHQRLKELAAKNPIARAAENQLSTLELLGLIRSEYGQYGESTLCSQLPAGYAVATAQPFEEILETTRETLPKVDQPEIVVEGEVSEVAVQTLADVATAVIEEKLQPRPEISYTAPLPKPTLKVGSSMSKASVVSASNLAVTKKSKISISRVSSSKKFCSMSRSRVKALKVGVCKVKVSVSQKGLKTKSKTVSITITKK